MIKKNDFIEIEFSGRVKDGEVFDTTLKEEAEKIGIKGEDVKPLIICVGEGMLVSGFDRAIEGKEIGKEYVIELNPKDAFGERNKNLIKTIPLRVFLEKKINPYPGLVLALDNMLARVMAVSGGRVITDFNNPLAGKIISYRFKILRKIDKIDEQINSFLDFFLKRRFEFEIKGKTIVFKIDDSMYESAVGILKDKFMEIFAFDIAFEIKSKDDKMDKSEAEQPAANKQKE